MRLGDACAACGLLALAACTDPPAGDAPPDADLSPDAAAASISDVFAVPSPANALAYFVEWRTEPAVPTILRVDCGPDYQHDFEDGEARTDHRVFVMGLWDGAICDMVIEAEVDGVVEATETEIVDVGPLPQYLPEIYLHAHDVVQVQPGWTLVNLTNGVLDEPFKLAMIDTEGRFRWYHELDVNHEGSDNDTRLVSEGILVGGLGGLIAPTIVDWQGNVVWREPSISMHHDMRPDRGDENMLLYATGTTDCPEDHWSDAVDLWDRENGERVWRWKSCQHYPPEMIEFDWFHLNTIVPVPGENQLLLSPRNLNRLVKIDRDTGDVVWELGVDLGWTLSPDPDDWFYHQHAPEIQPNGNIVLFDNGLKGVREYSRAIEIAYDTDSMTAEIVWEYAPQPPIFAPIWGDADRLPNGNTLSTFGRRGINVDTHLIEASPDGDKVWHVSFPNGWGSYRAQRVPDPPLGEVLAGEPAD